MNVTEITTPVKDKEDFYSYRLGLQVQAYGGAIIIILGLIGMYFYFTCGFDTKRLGYVHRGLRNLLSWEETHKKLSKKHFHKCSPILSKQDICLVVKGEPGIRPASMYIYVTA